ncbi:MAG: TonB-dependent receptor [Pseudoxanthomonas sp.]
MSMQSNHLRAGRRHMRGAALAIAVSAALQIPSAFAQEAKAAEQKKAVTLDEVVVTAQKRSERLQDTPVSAAVVTQKALEDANVSDISDLNKLVPSLQFKGSNNGRVPIAMRGISTTADEATIGLTSGVLIMLDGVPVASDAMGVNELSDLAQVEVLKGPQSTLGGRAASAGVVNLITRKPTDYWSGSFGVLATGDGEYKADGFISGPISEGAEFSLSAYKHRVELPIHNLATDKNSTTDSEGARLKLALHPSENVDVTFAAHAYDIDAKGSSFTYQYMTPDQAIFSFIPGGGAAYDAIFPGVTPAWGNTDYNSLVPMRAQTKGSDLSLNLDWRLGDYTLSSTTAYQRERQYNVQDVAAVLNWWNQARDNACAIVTAFCSFADWDDSQHVIVKPTTKSQEFKIVSPLDGRVNYVAGLFYSETDVWSSFYRGMPIGNPQNYTVNSNTKTLDAYGRITWKLADTFDLLTGLRFNHDTVSYWKDDVAYGGYSENEITENTWVGDVSLRKRFTPDAMAYLTYARGYKPAAFNTAEKIYDGDDPVEATDRETVDHFELGLKLALLDHALTLNTALFQTTYHDYQVQIWEPVGGAVSILKLDNAGAARTRGLEADLSWAATDALRLNASAAWIDAKFLDYGHASCWNGQTEAEGCYTDDVYTDGYQDLSGKSLPDAPKVKANLGADYTWFGDGGKRPDLTLSGQYAWRSGAYMQASHNPLVYQDGFGIFNLSLTGSWNNDKFRASLFVNNVFDKFYVVNLTENFSGIYSGTAQAITGQPARDASRYAGLRLNWNF